MENAEEIFHYLEDFSKRKPKTIPQELNEYLAQVARTGDPVYQWSLVKSLFKEKLLNVITDFYESSPGIDIPPYPNVDLFNYDIMKNSLLERLDSFTAAPFTVQRICELLTFPRKQYNRVDKFMRAIEKNILVVSTREPGIQRHAEPENGEPMLNGSDNNSEYNVDVEMEDMSWKDNAGQRNSEPQPGSSDVHISVGDIEARLKAKEETAMDTQEKTATQYESVTPPELNVTSDETPDNKPSEETAQETTEKIKSDIKNTPVIEDAVTKVDVEMKTESALVIPEIKVDDAEMTEQKLLEQAVESTKIGPSPAAEAAEEKESDAIEQKVDSEAKIDDNSSEASSKEESDKMSSSEESSSSSDTTDGNSNSPKTDERLIDVQDNSNQSSSDQDSNVKLDLEKSDEVQTKVEDEPKILVEDAPKLPAEDYSISDVSSELPQPQASESEKLPDKKDDVKECEEPKAEETSPQETIS